MNQVIKQENSNQLLSNIREILLSARHTAYKAVSKCLQNCYALRSE